MESSQGEAASSVAGNLEPITVVGVDPRLFRLSMLQHSVPTAAHSAVLAGPTAPHMNAPWIYRVAAAQYPSALGAISQSQSEDLVAGVGQGLAAVSSSEMKPDSAAFEAKAIDTDTMLQMQTQWMPGPGLMTPHEALGVPLDARSLALEWQILAANARLAVLLEQQRRAQETVLPVLRRATTPADVAKPQATLKRHRTENVNATQSFNGETEMPIPSAQLPSAHRIHTGSSRFTTAPQLSFSRVQPTASNGSQGTVLVPPPPARTFEWQQRQAEAIRDEKKDCSTLNVQISEVVETVKVNAHGVKHRIMSVAMHGRPPELGSLSDEDAEVDSNGDNPLRRPFVCSYPLCGKRYKQKRNMLAHERVHLDQYLYSCSICGPNTLRYKSKYYLDVHRRSHKPGEPGTRPRWIPTLDGLELEPGLDLKTEGDLAAALSVHEERYAMTFVADQIKILAIQYGIRLSDSTLLQLAGVSNESNGQGAPLTAAESLTSRA